MSDDPEAGQGGRPDIDREVLRRLGRVVGPLGGTTEITTWLTTGDFTTWRPGPGLAAGFTTWRPGPTTHPTLTTVADAEGGLKPGSYRIETRQVTEFDVLEGGQVVVRREETQGGEPEQRG
jgi:hypothetical protein